MNLNEPKAHAKLSASGSHRWLHCPASVALSETAPKGRDSVYAQEGTRAHEMLEGIFKAHINLSNPYTTIKELRDQSHDKEMVEHVAAAYREIEQRLKDAPGAILLSEEKISLEHIGPNMFGTVDAAIVEEFGTLQVWDFKYGAGIPVEAEGNTQLLYYAMGIAHKYEYNFEKVLIGVLQPRAEHECGPVRCWTLSIKELKEWELKFAEGVKATNDPLAAFCAGDWCRFCPAKAMCPEISTNAIKQAKLEFAPYEGDEVQISKEPSPLLSEPEQITITLKAIEKLKVWCDAFEDQAQMLMERGMKIEGYKLVRKRTIRKWVNEDITLHALASRYPKAVYLDPPSLKSPAQVEKSGGNKEVVDCLTSNEVGGLTMAHASDKRAAVDPLALEFSDDSVIKDPFEAKIAEAAMQGVTYTIKFTNKKGDKKMPAKSKPKRKKKVSKRRNDAKKKVRGKVKKSRK